MYKIYYVNYNLHNKDDRKKYQLLKHLSIKSTFSRDVSTEKLNNNIAEMFFGVDV